MPDWLAVNPTVRATSLWKPFTRIEDTGGNVQVVSDALQDLSPQKLVYAEGDSWFDKYTPLGDGDTNLLANLASPFSTALVDASLIGDTVENMTTGQEARQTRAMFEVFDFDAILLSAGGNDVIATFQQMFAAKASGQVPPGASFTFDDLDHLDHPDTYAQFFESLVSYFKAFIAMRDESGRERTRSAPIFLHGYDYNQPRPAAAYVLGTQFIGRGPWLYPNMKRSGLTGVAMRAASDAVVDELNLRLQSEIAVPGSNVFLVDQRGVLVPAVPDSTGLSNDWLDEIHPTGGGFSKLARQRWEVPLAKALGWQPGPGDVIPALPAVNVSTASA